jgi:hypothetical protein
LEEPCSLALGEDDVLTIVPLGPSLVAGGMTWGWPPRDVRGSGCHAAIAASANHTIRSPRRRRPSHSAVLHGPYGGVVTACNRRRLYLVRTEIGRPSPRMGFKMRTAMATSVSGPFFYTTQSNPWSSDPCNNATSGSAPAPRDVGNHHAGLRIRHNRMHN